MTPNRILIDVPLEPAIGSRFQPTGFPDLGHAEFQRPDGENCLLVESAQSMANRLEGALWDDADQKPDPALEGLPYVRVLSADGSFLTASRTEAHRLASAFIKDSMLDGTSMVDVIKSRLKLVADSPLDHRVIAAEIFRLDPLCLIHGVFFADSKWPGQPKIARALTGFIEASGVRRADSGGVKRDHVRHSIEGESGGSSEGYGSVPFARTEWTAQSIVASFSVDRKQLRSYGLGEQATQLLEDVALLEIRALIDGGLRLRTACDFVSAGHKIADREGDELPSEEALRQSVGRGVQAAGDLLDGTAVLDVRWNGGKKQSKKKNDSVEGDAP